jgi:hypothetical protein
MGRRLVCCTVVPAGDRREGVPAAAHRDARRWRRAARQGSAGDAPAKPQRRRRDHRDEIVRRGQPETLPAAAGRSPATRSARRHRTTSASSPPLCRAPDSARFPLAARRAGATAKSSIEPPNRPPGASPLGDGEPPHSGLMATRCGKASSPGGATLVEPGVKPRVKPLAAQAAVHAPSRTESLRQRLCRIPARPAPLASVFLLRPWCRARGNRHAMHGVRLRRRDFSRTARISAHHCAEISAQSEGMPAWGLGGLRAWERGPRRQAAFSRHRPAASPAIAHRHALRPQGGVFAGRLSSSIWMILAKKFAPALQTGGCPPGVSGCSPLGLAIHSLSWGASVSGSMWSATRRCVRGG